MKQIFLIRHFKCANADGLCYGRTDLLPDASFDDSMAALKCKLTGLAVEKIVASPLKRCSLIAQQLGCAESIALEPRIMEVDFGRWEGKLWNDIPREELDAWGASFVESAPHGGESFRQLYERAWAAFQDIRQLPFERIAVVTHAGPIRAILAGLLEIPLHRAFALNPNYGSVTKITCIDDSNITIDFL